MKIFSAINAIILLLGSAGCEPIKYLPDNPVTGLPTKVLMHRGNGHNKDYNENTLPAAQYGLSLMDGIELDIQISKDGTLWLDHDNEVYDCDGSKIGCFQTLSDDVIRSVSECDGITRYHTLESVFQLMVTEYPESYISLDIKGQYCQILKIGRLMHQMAESLLKLVDQYHLEGRVIAGSGSNEFLKEMDNQTSVIQCYVSLDDLEKGLRNAASVNARGIYQKFGKSEINADIVSYVHNKGFILVVWVVNESDDIKSMWESKPDFIETDNTKFQNYIKEGH